MAGEYTLLDFTESMDRVNIPLANLRRVVAAWGVNGGCAEWEGGFIVELNDGRFAYVWGWCDTTGWGCQDGAEVEYYNTEPERIIKRGIPQHFGGYVEILFGVPWGTTNKWEQDWDEAPADLNKFIADGCPTDRIW